MGSAFEQSNSATEETKISLDSAGFVDLVAAKALRDIEEREAIRNKKRRLSSLLISALIGVLTASSLAGLYYVERQSRAKHAGAQLSDTVDQALKSPLMQSRFDSAVEKAVGQRLDERFAEISSKIIGLEAYQRLIALTTQLEIKEAFSNDDRDEILGLLDTLKGLGGYMERPGFDRYLTKITDSFTSAYQVAAVERIDDLFRDDLAGIDDVPRWLTNHFGRVYVTSNNVTNSNSRQAERMRYYASVSKQNQNPEVTLLWDLVSSYVIAGEERVPLVDTIIGQIELLGDNERELFGRALLEEATASERDPADLRRLAMIVTKLVQDYKQELTGLGIEIE